MMRIETTNGILYYGDVFFGTEFVRVVPTQIMVFSKEANGYMELENFPKELFIPISRIEVIAQIENKTEEEITDEQMEKEIKEYEEQIENEELLEESEEELVEDDTK